jgi:hypothetical protein
VTESEKAPVTGHGGAEAVDGGAPIVAGGEDAGGTTTGETNIVETGGAGLSPRLPISAEPKGIPVRPTPDIDRAGIEEPTPPVPAQALDADPAMPPPSNSGVGVCDVGPAALEQPRSADGAGLVPGVGISVAPSGMPVGATGMPAPMDRGDAAPSAEVPNPPTWAQAELPPRRETAKVAVTKRLFMGSTLR